ncbi:MAG: DUF86 domain-containing protein [bacterium]|nr:DUF86 domain-containing protein [bacterium]MDD5757318.1 DUF86 domain-containing protein [bacterium]
MIKRDFRDYIKDIIESIHDIEKFITGMDYVKFSKDKKTINAVVRSVEIIGEATKKLPKAFRDKYTDIPWKKMAGMRDKLIHEYFGIDKEILWKVAEEDIPALKLSIKKITKLIK